MMSKNFLYCLFFISNGLLAQQVDNQQLHFNIKFGEMALLANEEVFYKLDNGDSLQIEMLKFYISGIEFWNNGQAVWKEASSFHLIDISNTKTTHISIPKDVPKHFNQIKFNLGIDSTTHEEGAMGGDLDPTKGMYWTWQSGYINFKLEGKSPICPTRHHEFQFHLGGYQYPFNTLQTIILDISSTKHPIEIQLDIKKWISQLDLRKQNHLMSPNELAVQLSEKLISCFSILSK